MGEGSHGKGHGAPVVVGSTGAQLVGQGGQGCGKAPRGWCVAGCAPGRGWLLIEGGGLPSVTKSWEPGCVRSWEGTPECLSDERKLEGETYWVCLEQSALGLDWRLSSHLDDGKRVAVVCHGAAFSEWGAHPLGNVLNTRNSELNWCDKSAPPSVKLPHLCTLHMGRTALRNPGHAHSGNPTLRSDDPTFSDGFEEEPIGPVLTRQHRLVSICIQNT